jgi:hypothetical protein
MKRWWLILGVVTVASAVTIGVLARENARLQGELDAARRVVAPAALQAAGPVPDGTGTLHPPRGGGNPLALLNTLGRAIGDRPPAGETPPSGDAGPVDWESRRAQRQQRMRDLLGRRPGESAEDYKARVAPMVETILSIPRDRVNERRRQFEEAAGVNAEQKAKLDAAFQEASAEVIGLANTAVASGDLTPYQRNTRGVLAFVGSTVGTVDALDQRLRTILTPEQQAVMEESGFDPLEYLGASSPWETLDAPPPPPSGRPAGM